MIKPGVIPTRDGRIIETQGGELSFAPPETAMATWKDGIPRSVNSPDNVPDDTWKGSNAFCILPPANPKILGLFCRGIVPGSIILKNHDGSVTYHRDIDYIYNEEQGMILGVKNRLGPRPVDPKQPRPDEMLTADFQYFMQRLDLVQADAGGKLSIKQSPGAIMCPILPEPDAGHIGLAGVWVFGVHTRGPVPRCPEEVRIEADDIAVIRPCPPVAPVNPQALRPVLQKLAAGEPVGIGFFGDSIAVGAEVADWYFHSYSVRNAGFVGMVLRDLQAKYPQADVHPAWSIAGAQSIFNEKLWSNVLKYCAPRQGRSIWKEAEEPNRLSPPQPPVEDLTIRDDSMRRVLAGGQWLELSGGTTDSPAFAEYDFDIAEAGEYTLFIRSVRQRGALRWRWNDRPWTELPPVHQSLDAEDVRQFVALCWYEFAPVPFTAGKQTLRIELIPGENLAGFSALDCLMLTKDRIQPWSKEKPDELKVDVIVYAMGMNGAHNEQTPREMHKETILRHIREARECGAEVLLVATMENSARRIGDPSRSKKANRDLLAEIAAETGAPFADVYTEWINQTCRGIPPDSRLHNFNNHPDIVGHRLWADVILRCFLDAGK